jgi:hypothetical protein
LSTKSGIGKEIAPSVTRAAVLLDTTAPTGFGQLGAIQSVAPSLGVEISAINIRVPGTGCDGAPTVAKMLAQICG